MTLWEKFISRLGFKNIYQEGQCIGFQFNIIIPYYRGIFISCINDFVVKVDNESFSKDKIKLKIGDRVVQLTKIDDAYDIFWNYGTKATVIVDKPRGLSDGLHTVECGLNIRKSYMPTSDPEGLYDFSSRFVGSSDNATQNTGGYNTQLQTCSLPMTIVV